MGQITVSVNGRTYRLRCGDGEEARLSELAAYVGQRVDDLAAEFGQVGDERLLLMATLLVADEMLDLKARLAELERPGAASRPAKAGKPDAGRESRDRLARTDRSGGEPPPTPQPPQSTLQQRLADARAEPATTDAKPEPDAA